MPVKSCRFWWGATAGLVVNEMDDSLQCVSASLSTRMMTA